MALPLPGLMELFVLLAVALFAVAFYVGVFVLGVRIALAFVDHPESEEIQKRVALLERKVERLDARVQDGETDPADDASTE